jgi:hypothetical protein
MGGTIKAGGIEYRLTLEPFCNHCRRSSKK